MRQFGFEKLEVWQLAIELSVEIYEVTRSFPQDERFGLSNQLRRAANSISANLAEGSGRGSNKDFQRFIGISFGSLMEVVSHLHIARKQNFIPDEQFNFLIERSHQIARMLSSL